MKHYKYTLNNLAAGVVLLLAVIFVTACTNNTPPPPTKPAAIISPTDTPAPTAIPAKATATATAMAVATATVAHTATVAPSPTQTPISPTSTPTLSESKEPTITPSITPLPPTPTVETAEQLKLTPTLAVETQPSAGVKVYKTTITLPTYPIKDYLTEQVDPVYNIPVFYFNRSEYEAANPTPTPIDYAGVVLENPYLRLTFMPELGGRLYSAVIKSTDQEVFYHNLVVKPSRYGVLQPYEANWWLATGGMEWAYPTQEHGYRFGVAWDYSVSQDSNGATITLSDTAPDRTGLMVDVTLPADSSTFTVAPRLVNNGPDNAPVQLWTNAVLALTSGSMSPQTQFVVPADTITVHSRGELGWTVPGEHEQAPWPQVGETDLRDYSQWANYLGFFVPNQKLPFIGAYNPATNLGIVRLVAPGATSGSGKLFTFGPGFPDRSYTDDDSQYFEIWGGANAGFWPEDDIAVPAGQTLGWQETWWPLAQLGGITWATDRVAIHLSRTGDNYTLSALMSQPAQGTLQVSAGDVSLLTETFSTDPAALLQWNFAAAADPAHIRFVDNNGAVLLEYQVD